MDDPIEMMELLFENGKEGEYYEGDTVMQKLTDEYIIFKSVSYSRTDQYSRILKRADGPVWRNALAVLARCSSESALEVFRKSEVTPNVWQGEGGWAHTDDLRDVTPMIPATVDDEMLVRAINAYDPFMDQARVLSDLPVEHVEDFRRALIAALSVE